MMTIRTLIYEIRMVLAYWAFDLFLSFLPTDKVPTNLLIVCADLVEELRLECASSPTTADLRRKAH